MWWEWTSTRNFLFTIPYIFPSPPNSIWGLYNVVLSHGKMGHHLTPRKVLPKMILETSSCLLGWNENFLHRTNLGTMFEECWYVHNLVYAPRRRQTRQERKRTTAATTMRHEFIRKILSNSLVHGVHKRTTPYIIFVAHMPPTWHMAHGTPSAHS